MEDARDDLIGRQLAHIGALRRLRRAMTDDPDAAHLWTKSARFHVTRIAVLAEAICTGADRTGQVPVAVG